MNIKRVAGLCVLAVWAVLAPGVSPAADPPSPAVFTGGETESHSYVVDKNDEKIWDDAFTKLVKDKLNGRYQNLQVVVGACGSGGFATEAKSGANALGGNWSVSTSRGTRAETTTQQDSEKNSGESGLKIGDSYYHGWTPQWIKKLKSDKAATSKTLADCAKKHDHRIGDPKFEKGGTGDESKIHDGAMSNHAIIWSPARSKIDREVMSALYDQLDDAGYDDGTIDYAYDSFGGQNVNDNPVDHDATKGNLETMLTAMGTALNAHNGQEKAFIWINAHGNTEKRKVEKDEKAPPKEPGQGQNYLPGTGPDLDLDQEFVSLLLEDVAVNDPEAQRQGPATVQVTTFQEAFAGPVAVLLDGVHAGFLFMLGSPLGAHYEMDIADPALLALAGSHALDDLHVQVIFQFPFGSFRIATPLDAELLNLEHYGVGLAGPPIAGKVETGVNLGACCMLDGTCADGLLEVDCLALVGSYWGDGTICAPSLCPFPPPAACCFPDGFCTDESPPDCLGENGEPQAGTVCAGDGDGDYLDELCQVAAPCPWDCGNANGEVDVVDLLALLGHWGGPGPCDFDGGGASVTDLLKLLAHWGDCP